MNPRPTADRRGRRWSVTTRVIVTILVLLAGFLTSYVILEQIIPRLSEDPRMGHQFYSQHHQRQQQQQSRHTFNDGNDNNNPASTKTHYEVLGVHPNASDAELRSAHRQAARQYHPDRVRATDRSDLGAERATEHMIRINNAYDVLSDKRRRCEYDFEIGLPRGKHRGYAAYQQR